MTRQELTPAQWQRLLKLLPPQKRATGRPSKDRQQVVTSYGFTAAAAPGEVLVLESNLRKRHFKPLLKAAELPETMRFTIFATRSPHYS